jgi:sigma-B regulation protein RsbU (phosphoserine phosphatase)
MKFRWKLLILLLVISIVPIISLRTFGIHSVHLMAEALFSQVKEKQVDDARHLLQLVIDDYSKAVRTAREQVEMTLFYETFQARNLLQTELLQHNQSNPSRGSDSSCSTANVIIDKGSDFSVDSGLNADENTLTNSHLCFSIPPTLDAAHARLDVERLKRMRPIYQAASLYLGDLVLRQYLGLENGLFSVYPCSQEISLEAGTDKQTWYQSAFEEKATAWSRPYIDSTSGRTVMAVSYPVTGANENVIGVASLLVPLSRLLEEALLISELPAGTMPYLITLALNPSGGIVGAKILSSEKQQEILPSTQGSAQKSQWLVSSDKMEFRAMLEDIARRQSRIREMPFNNRMSFWAYGPLMHQGSAFVFIVPQDNILNLKDQPILASIQRRLNKVENYTAGFLLFLILLASVLALVFSRTVTRPLAQLSAAAKKLSGGDFEARVSIASNDEFGKVGNIFNSIGPQLKEHYRTLRSLEVAEEIQQNLLPEESPEIPGLDIYGMTLFSDETGGDYFDYLCVDEEKKEKLCVTVGDVAGHGIPSALLMATVRGFLRLRARIPGTLGDIISDINKEFEKDAEDSGQFMTMFLARIERGANRIDWVRAGHDPAILYDPETDTFHTLDEGRGLPLGVSKDAVYKASSCDIKPGQIITLGTDGIWEARNADGELFGKERLQQVVQKNSRESARMIVLSVFDAVEAFRGQGEQEDDLTLVVIKIADVSLS